MELDDLKSEWNIIEFIPKKEKALLLMLQENKHPVLKSIRKQIVIEVSAWSLFLMVYYSMLDGSKKPFWINVLLVLAFALPIIHSIYGYYYNKYLTDGSDIKTSLEQLYTKLKKYALITIIARIGLISGMLLFLTYNIHFTTVKYFLLVLILFLFFIQLFVLYQLWIKNLRALQRIIKAFNEFK